MPEVQEPSLLNLDVTTLSAEMVEQLRFAARKSLFFFAKGILGYSWLEPEIHGEICRRLENRSNLYLKFVLPRGWYKTTLISIAYPIWCTIQEGGTEERILLVQNTATNAKSKLISIDSIFKKNKLFRALFPELLPTKNEVWNSEQMAVPRRGHFPESTFECAGTKTQLVSRHYTQIIEDDTVAPDRDELGAENLLPTKDDIEQAIGFHRLAAPLLVDQNTSRNIVVGTRWFQRDLLSWIDEHEKSFFLSYERAAQENEVGLADEFGKPTFPQRFPQHVLDVTKARLGPYLYSCLYLNKPVNTETMVFQKNWITFWDKTPERLWILISVDPSTDKDRVKGKNPDKTAIVVTGKDLITGFIYVLDYAHSTMNPGEMIDEIFRLALIWKPVDVLIEGIAYQNTIEYHLRERMRKTDQYFNVTTVTGTTNKEAKIRGLQPLVKAGVIKFAKWMSAMFAELEAFPLGQHDDLIDALSMQLKRWALTAIPEHEKQMVGKDPMSVDAAIDELERKTLAAQGKKKSGFLSRVLRNHQVLQQIPLEYNRRQSRQRVS